MTRDMHLDLFARYIFSCNDASAHTAVTACERKDLSRATYPPGQIRVPLCRRPCLDPAGGAYSTLYATKNSQKHM